MLTPRQLADVFSEMPAGNGWRGELPIGLDNLRDSSGEPLTSTTTPSAGMVGSQFAISDGPPGLNTLVLHFTVPRDYDYVKDPELVIQVVARQSVAEGSAIGMFLANIVASRPGTAVRTGFTVSSQSVSSTTDAIVSFDLGAAVDSDGRGLRPGDAVTASLTTGAHSTASLVITNLCGMYRRNPNFTNQTARNSDSGFPT